MNSFVLECVSTFSVQAKSNQIRLEVKHLTVIAAPDQGNSVESSQPDMISIDKFKMAQVVRNLISNAFKFTSPGGSVTISSSFVPILTGNEGLVTNNKESASSHSAQFKRKGVWNMFASSKTPRSCKSSHFHVLISLYLSPDVLVELCFTNSTILHDILYHTMLYTIQSNCTTTSSGKYPYR